MEQITKTAPSQLSQGEETTRKCTYDELNQLLYITSRRRKDMKKVVDAKQAELQLLEDELQTLKKIPNTFTYKLGQCLLLAKKSPMALIRLPITLWLLVREQNEKRAKRKV
jgi:hypothetical protein